MRQLDLLYRKVWTSIGVRGRAARFTVPPITVIDTQLLLLNTDSILFEDNHLLVVSKPAGIATMGARPGEPSLAEEAKKYLKQKYDKPGNVFLGIVSRLDAHVSGVIVFARTSKAASRLSEQFRESTVSKKYLAVVSGQPRSSRDATNPWNRLDSYLRKNERLHRVESFTHEVPGSRRAVLEYRIVRGNRQYSLLEIDLKTGRKHQIRAQFAEIGCPIVGDRKYDSTVSWGRQIALHAHELSINHPTQQKKLTFTAKPPAAWHKDPQISELLKGI